MRTGNRQARPLLRLQAPLLGPVPMTIHWQAPSPRQPRLEPAGVFRGRYILTTDDGQRWGIDFPDSLPSGTSVFFVPGVPGHFEVGWLDGHRDIIPQAKLSVPALARP